VPANRVVVRSLSGAGARPQRYRTGTNLAAGGRVVSPERSWRRAAAADRALRCDPEAALSA
jgi:hypothetical protein